jgi:hypothetical protein
MSALIIDTNQVAQIGNIETFIDTAFKYGVEDTLANPVLDELLNFNSANLTNAQRQIVKDVFKLALCALLKELGGTSGTIALAKITGGGTDGFLVFTNGILTSFQQPT